MPKKSQRHDMEAHIEVECVNGCEAGQIRHYPNDRALYYMVPCPFCMGSGYTLSYKGETADQAFIRIERKLGL